MAVHTCRTSARSRAHVSEPHDVEARSRGHVSLDSRCRAGARPPPSSRSIPTGQWPTRRHTAEHSRRRLGHATLDAMHGVAVTPSSTVAEHRDLVIREKVRANAPGRIEGRCEHHDRAVVPSRATRPGLCLTSEGAHDDGEACAHATRAAAHCSVTPMADATLATSQATSQARTTLFAHRAAPLGPAGPFACPSAQACGHATLDSRCRAGAPSISAGRRHAAEHTFPSRTMARLGHAVT